MTASGEVDQTDTDSTSPNSAPTSPTWYQNDIKFTKIQWVLVGMGIIFLAFVLFIITLYLEGGLHKEILQIDWISRQLTAIEWQRQLIQQRQASKANYQSPNKIIYISPTRAPIPDPPKPQIVNILQRQTPEGTEDITVMSYSTKIISWQDWWIYQQNNLILAHNKHTGKTITVFDLADKTKLKQLIGTGAEDNALYFQAYLPLSYLQVIQNKLILGFGEYMFVGGIFYTQMPPAEGNEVYFISQARNPAIQKQGADYWLVEGEGDACWSYHVYYHLNLNTMELDRPITIDSGCYEGEMLATMDPHGRFIVLTYNKGKNDTEFSPRVIREVVALDYHYPGQRDMILSSTQMPDSIYGAIDLEESSKLLLLGKKLYILDLNNYSLQATDYQGETLGSWGKGVLFGQIACIQPEILKENKLGKLAINLETGKISSDETCNWDEINQVEKPESLEDKIKSLELPDNYQVISRVEVS